MLRGDASALSFLLHRSHDMLCLSDVMEVCFYQCRDLNSRTSKQNAVDAIRLCSTTVAAPFSVMAAAPVEAAARDSCPEGEQDQEVKENEAEEESEDDEEYDDPATAAGAGYILLPSSGVHVTSTSKPAPLHSLHACTQHDFAIGRIPALCEYVDEPDVHADPREINSIMASMRFTVPDWAQ